MSARRWGPPPPPRRRSPAAAASRTLRAVAACVAVVPVVGFDIEAHDAVGQTAASAMDQEAIRNFKKLLGGQDASDVAGWGHQADATFPGLARMHFQVHDDRSGQPWCGPKETRVALCPDNVCLLSAIKHFYGKILLDEGRRIDYPDIDYSKVAQGIQFKDADAVKMLINLIGDMHQPLHVGYASDDNGHNVQVNFEGKQMSLYDVWDKGIGELVRQRQSNFWYGGWTHVNAVREQYEADKKFWQEKGAFAAFDRWMDEEVDFACNNAYKDPGTGKLLGGPQGPQSGQLESISPQAYSAWKDAWLKRILIGGARVAIVMNDIMDAQGASKLKQGTGVKTEADLEKEKMQADWAKEAAAKRRAETSAKGFFPTFNFSVFVTNLGIACVTVPLFFLFVNHGLNPKTHMELLRTLMESGSGGGGGGSGRGGKRQE